MGIKMAEIEVNEYVRTEYGISKVIEKLDRYVTEEQICVDCIGGMYNQVIPKQKVVKHSKQLENLIEINDIVNGYRILEIYEATESNDERILDIGYGMAIFNDEIKTILTKEQMEANCYKVGGEDGI